MPGSALVGTLHEPAEPRLAGLAGFATPVGRFRLDAETDPRLDPRMAMLSTEEGDWLLALTAPAPQLLHPPRRDPGSGRALRADAPEGALCPTGEEPGCWREGDAPLPGHFVARALCAALGSPVEGCVFMDLPPRAPETVFTAPSDLGLVGASGSDGIDLWNADSGVLLQSFPGVPAGFDTVLSGTALAAHSAQSLGLPLLVRVPAAAGSL